MLIEEFTSLTLGDVITAAPYVVGVPLGVFILWRIQKMFRRVSQAMEETPGRTSGSFLTFLGVALGPFLTISLMDVDPAAGFGALGASGFCTVVGLLMMIRGHQSGDIEGSRRDWLECAAERIDRARGYVSDTNALERMDQAREKLRQALERRTG
jgi:hypothetical protein